MTMLFYVALIFVKNPLILGLAQGVSLATFWPSFNLLQFRLSGAKARARTISLYSSIIPSIAGIFGPATGGFMIQNFGFTCFRSFNNVVHDHFSTFTRNPVQSRDIQVFHSQEQNFRHFFHNFRSCWAKRNQLACLSLLPLPRLWHGFQHGSRARHNRHTHLSNNVLHQLAVRHQENPHRIRDYRHSLKRSMVFRSGFCNLSQIIVLSLLSGSHGSPTMETRSPMNNTLAYSS